ncbi:MAG: pyridoxamine 5'-phosphate oxidase [Actinomycetota bacterium]|nr:pyridoxamine 5'-phosphate oxidase [Rubrobacter sp.]MDQ3506476.1 pyridoxamine 5'-phosphate oxidase [Actinomycetota bacterium]
MDRDISELRQEYARSGLHESDLDPDPVEQFRAWLSDAFDANLVEPNAMTLATATSDGIPSARIVLLRGFDERGFCFYTNYEGRKGGELSSNPRAALVFYWGALERQVRIEGGVSRLSEEESGEYFASRPRGSRIGAWVSEQSELLEKREALEERVEELEREYADGEIPRPHFWGGFRVEPERVEFWQGRESRLHDRLLYERGGDGWGIVRLQP